MTILEKMDGLVYATRLDRIFFRKLQPRAFRWTPLLVIAAMIAGYVLMARKVTIADYLTGSLIFYGAIVAAGLLRIFGPRFTAPLDERELMIKSRAYAGSGVALAMVVMICCFYMSGAGALGLWQPRAFDWINLGFGIQGAGALLPTWIASWIEPRRALELDD